MVSNKTPRHASTRLRLVALGLPLIAGCASVLNPVGGTDTFACKAPPGVACTSVSGVYANAVVNNLPSQRPHPAAATATTTAEAGAGGDALPVRQTIAGHAPGAGSAIRSDPRVVRIWLAPWQDAEGDLHDQAYIYVTVDPGTWLIEHTRAPIRRDFAPLRLRAQGDPPTHSSDKPSNASDVSATRLALPTPAPTTGGPDVQ